MTVDTTAAPNQEQQSKPSEFNFRQLEAKYERMLAQEKAEKERLLREVEEARKAKPNEADDEDDSEPYVDTKRLEKKLSSFERKIEEKIDKKAEEKARGLMESREREHWLEANPDFYDVVQQHAEAFANKVPKIAESILRMPESFERQKLVYNSIKALGIDKPADRQPSIQEKIDANKRSPYYQPTNVAPAPYAGAGDFSPTGQKNAFEKMKELQNRLRL